MATAYSESLLPTFQHVGDCFWAFGVVVELGVGVSQSIWACVYIRALLRILDSEYKQCITSLVFMNESTY
jgi:hypothetical protein